MWHADRIERLLPKLEGVDLVHTDARLVDANGVDLGDTLLSALGLSAWERKRMQHGDAFEALLRRNLVTGATVLVRREVAVAALPVPEGWIHDEWLAMVCALGGGVRLVPEATIDYRQHDANQIGVERLTVLRGLRRLLTLDAEAQARKVQRAWSLADRARRDPLGTSAHRLALTEKLNHERSRARTQSEIGARIPNVLRGIASGRYRRYSRGFPDAIRDLFGSETGRT